MAERPIPYTIGVCALIALHSDPDSPLQPVKLSRRVVNCLLEDTWTFNDDGHGIGDINSQEYSEDTLSLERWVAKVDEFMGSRVVEVLLNVLHMATESVDGLIDLFDSFSLSLQKGLVDPSSVHGLYIRKVRLGFDELSFEAITVLWRTLKERVEAIQRKMDREDEGELKEIPSDTPKEWMWPLSTQQLQDILRQECLDYEMDPEKSKLYVLKRHKRRRARQSFEQMEVHIRRMLLKDPALPAAYFLRYLNCLRHGERVGALDALHQYFDNTLVQQSSGKSGQDILQFSAILLAMTHSSFGDADLSLMATEEAVRVAQQSKDAACVAFALGWLFEYQGQRTAERRDILQRCASRANQKQLRPLVAGAQLSLARHALDVNGNKGRDASSGGSKSHPMSSPFLGDSASSWQAAWVHLQEVTSEPKTDQRVFDRPTYLYEDPKDTTRVTSLQQLVSAGILNEIGLPDMSQAASMAALQSSECLSYDDVVTAIQNLSRVTVYGTFAGNDQKEDSPFCAYARSIDTMLKLRKEFGLAENDLEELLLQNIALTLHEWAVCRGDLDDAVALQILLDSLPHPGLGNYDQLYFDIQMQKCLFLSRTQNWAKAKATAKSILKICKKTGPLSNQIRVLLQIATMQLESDHMQCTSALTALMEALALSDELEMHGLHAVGMSILAKVFLRLQNPSRAVAVLNGVLPTVSQKEHIRHQAEAYLTLAKAHLKIAATESKESRAMDALAILPYSLKQRFGKALTALEKSSHLFDEMQDRFRLRECLFLQAHVQSLLGNKDQREKISEKFFRLGSQQGPSTGGTAGTTVILDALNDPAELEKLVHRSIE